MSALNRARDFEFINISSPVDLRLPKNQKAVRSRAAVRSGPSRRNVRQPRDSPSEQTEPQPEAQAVRLFVPRDSSQGQGSSSDESPKSTPYSMPNPQELLGQGKVDPFRTYPVPWDPSIPALYLASDVLDMDEPGQPSFMKTQWWSLALGEPALFWLNMMFAASHSQSTGKCITGPGHTLRLKSQAIAALNQSLADDRRSVNDALIGAVPAIGSYEIIYGQSFSAHIHMTGLQRIVALRGGLDALGFHGFLQQIVLWMDRNQASLTGRKLYFPEASTKALYCPPKVDVIRLPRSFKNILTLKFLLDPTVADALTRLQQIIAPLNAVRATNAAADTDVRISLGAVEFQLLRLWGDPTS
ncbi:hypothetical protein H2201_006219 [Coniosporium apollinis]|uniref:Uncharacterized protein n=1 Tax=Coniosporium apollinis TaxID=61459 RepID=A0ABQ9NMP6_9PEZI|nr:hypothetical protein H2201_006219 [Coniosporium apollinis]